MDPSIAIARNYHTLGTPLCTRQFWFRHLPSKEVAYSSTYILFSGRNYNEIHSKMEGKLKNQAKSPFASSSLFVVISSLDKIIFYNHSRVLRKKRLFHIGILINHVSFLQIRMSAMPCPALQRIVSASTPYLITSAIVIRASFTIKGQTPVMVTI